MCEPHTSFPYASVGVSSFSTFSGALSPTLRWECLHFTYKWYCFPYASVGVSSFYMLCGSVLHTVRNAKTVDFRLLPISLSCNELLVPKDLLSVE